MNDTRIPCKYGANCYQTNEPHRKKFKHEEQEKLEGKDDGPSPNKKGKVESPPARKEPEDKGKGESPAAKKEPEKDGKEKSPTAKKEPEKDGKGGSPAAKKKPEKDGKGKSPTAKKEPEEKDKGESSADQKDHETSKPKEPSTAPQQFKNLKESLKEKFLVEMPDEFFAFWEFCKSVNSKKPTEAFSDCGLLLVGPFEALSRDLSEISPDQLLRLWRYYYDPPEFQTLLKGDDKTQFHMGYFRDSPDEVPVFVASNSAAEGCVIKPIAPTLFAAMDMQLASKIKAANPFQQMKFKKLQSALHVWAKKLDISLTDKGTMNARKKKVVCQSFHKAGLVTPYNKTTTIGYRKIEEDATLRKLLDAIAEAQTEARREKEMEELDIIITNTSIANDEHDFGGSLEVGMNLFCHGHPDFHTPAIGILSATYSLLSRDSFTRILQAHLKDRKKGVDLGL